MHMSYHYSSPGARWVFAAATLIYALAAGLAPVLHSAEGAQEVREYASALSDRDQTDTHSTPLPPAPHDPDDLSCLLCQVMTSPAQTISPEVELLYAPSIHAQPPANAPVMMRVSRVTAGARAPPHLS